MARDETERGPLKEIIDRYSETSATVAVIRVGIVDSGLDAFELKSVHIEPGIVIDTETQRISESADVQDVTGHGTGIADIISRLAPKCHIVPIRILDEDLVCPVDSLTTAITWGADNNIDILNLSLGTVSRSQEALERLRNACRYAAERGVLLVAAQLNDGSVCYPAVFPHVISVTCGEIHDPYRYFRSINPHVDFVARGNRQRVAWKDGTKRLAMGSSFACAHMTGIAAIIGAIERKSSTTEWKETLDSLAASGEAPLIKDGLDSFYPSSIISDESDVRRTKLSSAEDSLRWIGNAALYPFNKEMHAVFRFRDFLDFKIVSVGDFLTRGLIGKDPATLLGQPPSGHRIVHRFDALFERADTLILGHLEQLSEISHDDLFYRLASDAVERGLNLFTFIGVEKKYPQLVQKMKDRGLHLYSPLVDDNTYWSVRDEVLNPEPSPRVPVLGFFGTSRSQGKFTSQLYLRYGLMGCGYRVAQIGTEPHSSLFGIDFTFPIGYYSAIHMPLSKFVTFLECKYLQMVRQKKPDIFLFGTQGPMLSRGFRGKTFTLAAQTAYAVPSEVFNVSMIMGLKPDAAALAVNGYDPPDHITNCIRAIESIGACPVLFLTLGDQKRELRSSYGRAWIRGSAYGPGELEEAVARIEKEHGLPVYVPAVAEHARRMTDRVVDYFSSFSPVPPETTSSP